MRVLVLLALFALFFFSRFPTISVSDLVIVSILAIAGIVLAARTLFQIARRLVDQAYDARVDSFVKDSWAKYRNHGFNWQMTLRLAQCFIVIVCVKYGFDVIKHAAEHVPSVQARAY